MMGISAVLRKLISIWASDMFCYDQGQVRQAHTSPVRLTSASISISRRSGKSKRMVCSSSPVLAVGSAAASSTFSITLASVTGWCLVSSQPVNTPAGRSYFAEQMSVHFI